MIQRFALRQVVTMALSHMRNTLARDIQGALSKSGVGKSGDLITFEVKGVKELGQRLAQFPARLQRAGLRRSVYAGAAVLRARARAKAQAIGLRDKGNLVRGIKLRRLRGSRWEQKYGAYHSGKGWYGKLYEKGFQKPSGKRTQRPHLRPALDEGAREITQAIQTRLAREIETLAVQMYRDGRG